MIVSSMSVRAFYVARALIISAILAVGLVLLTASPATATPSVFTYDAAAHAYDARVLLSSPDTGTTSVRGSPPGPEAASWVSPASVGDRGVAANTGTARFVVNSAGDVLDTTRVSIPAGKFDYLLKNPSKSGVSSDSMGFDQAGLDSALRSHLTGNFGSASPSVPMVGGGTKFTVRGPMTGPSGQTWDITTAWGVDPNGTIRLITATP